MFTTWHSPRDGGPQKGAGEAEKGCPSVDECIELC